MTDLQLHQRTTEVTVCAVPEGSVNHHSYAITVTWRGGETYAVMHQGFRLDADGRWGYDTHQIADDARTLFDYDTALRLARDAAPGVTVNGWSATQAAAFETRETRA